LPIDTLPRTHNTFCERSFAAVDGARDWNSLPCSSLHPRDMTYNVRQFNSIGNWS